jgi:hypothetical protein
MERELYRRVYQMAWRLGRRYRSPHVMYPDWLIVVVYFWAVLHDRPTCWACDRRNWPSAAYDLQLPSCSTMSRRLHRPALQQMFDAMQQQLCDRQDAGPLCFIDAKPLPVGGASSDREAKAGYAAGRIAKGYKLHVIYSAQRFVVAWQLRPMNEKEARVAPALIEQLTGRGTLVGDNAYDSNNLYTLAGQRHWQLVAPRQRHTQLGKIRHSPWRLKAHQQMTKTQRRDLYEQRRRIEQFFGHLGNYATGLSPLPNWVRSLPRTRRWVQAKLIVYHLRQLHKAA